MLAGIVPPKAKPWRGVHTLGAQPLQCSSQSWCRYCRSTGCGTIIARVAEHHRQRYSMWKLRRWLQDLPLHDPIERRQALLVQVVLLGLSGVLLFSALLTLAAYPFTA